MNRPTISPRSSRSRRAVNQASYALSAARLASFPSCTVHCLPFVVGMHRIVNRVVQASALLALQGEARDEIAHVDHIAQLADVLRCLHALKQSFRLFIEHVQSVPGAVQSQVRAHDAHIVRHNLVHLLHALRNQHLLLVGHRALVVPFGHAFVKVIQVDVLQRVASGSIGIDHGLDERVAGQAVAAVQARAIPNPQSPLPI